MHKKHDRMVDDRIELIEIGEGTSEDTGEPGQSRGVLSEENENDSAISKTNSDEENRISDRRLRNLAILSVILMFLSVVFYICFVALMVSWLAENCFGCTKTVVVDGHNTESFSIV
ncbi:GfV-B3-ORF1 [Ichnoviriform fumiferanae]|uniref:GfV-B3-ORF1 n=1 Tax=Ichnoviriform fumiferanae TaxID=419435 RepID=A2PZQ4_9VIRU|nr:GfV-B3-ORF1 [Ichnoviriform fumiferanae]BAF45476.1 GfV-B3-ORF1 [Ichnoviriform fumiferanae]